MSDNLERMRKARSLTVTIHEITPSKIYYYLMTDKSFKIYHWALPNIGSTSNLKALEKGKSYYVKSKPIKQGNKIVYDWVQIDPVVPAIKPKVNTPVLVISKKYYNEEVTFDELNRILIELGAKPSDIIKITEHGLYFVHEG